MKYLAIDTSTERASIALAVNEDIFIEEQHAMRQHAHVLLPIVETLLGKAKISLNQLDGIVFGRGPGSFTGLRIACSVAKALAYAHDLPIYPVSTLAAIAYEARKQEKGQPVLSVMDARMDQLYWGYFIDDSYEVQEQVSDAAEINIPLNQAITIAGVGFERYLSDFNDALTQQIQATYTIYPHAQAMINLVQSGLVEAVTAEQAMPVYIRNKVTHGGSGG